MGDGTRGGNIECAADKARFKCKRVDIDKCDILAGGDLHRGEVVARVVECDVVFRSSVEFSGKSNLKLSNLTDSAIAGGQEIANTRGCCELKGSGIGNFDGVDIRGCYANRASKDVPWVIERDIVRG